MLDNMSTEMCAIRNLVWARRQLKRAAELLDEVVEAVDGTTNPEMLYEARRLAGRAAFNLHQLVGPDETTYIGGMDVFATGGETNV